MKVHDDCDCLESSGKLMGLTSVWWVFVCALVLATAIGIAYVNPWFTDKDTQNTRESNSYVTSKQSSLRSLKVNYDVLETRKIEAAKNLTDDDLVRGIVAQQHAIVRQMREQADLIPEHVPSDIKAFLDSQ